MPSCELNNNKNIPKSSTTRLQLEILAKGRAEESVLELSRAEAACLCSQLTRPRSRTHWGVSL